MWPRRDVLGTIPSLVVAICLNADSDRSIELLLVHVGQASAMTTVTDYEMVSYKPCLEHRH